MELARELFLVAGALLFTIGSLRVATGKDTNKDVSGILIAYGALPFATESLVKHQYIYFLAWVSICSFGLGYVYQHSRAKHVEIEIECDKIKK